jgi:hypothetical protein
VLGGRNSCRPMVLLDDGTTTNADRRARDSSTGSILHFLVAPTGAEV